jgi:hypothetical protein
MRTCLSFNAALSKDTPIGTTLVNCVCTTEAFMVCHLVAGGQCRSGRLQPAFAIVTFATSPGRDRNVVDRRKFFTSRVAGFSEMATRVCIRVQAIQLRDFGKSESNGYVSSVLKFTHIADPTSAFLRGCVALCGRPVLALVMWKADNAGRLLPATRGARDLDTLGR